MDCFTKFYSKHLRFLALASLVAAPPVMAPAVLLLSCGAKLILNDWALAREVAIAATQANRDEDFHSVISVETELVQSDRRNSANRRNQGMQIPQSMHAQAMTSPTSPTSRHYFRRLCNRASLSRRQLAP